MSAASFGFVVAAALALIGGLTAVLARRSDHALAGFAVAAAALLVPLVQLQASAVAALTLLASAVAVVLLGTIVRIGGPGPGQGRAPIAYWIPAGLGLLGFAWVVLATGSRQVVDHGPPMPHGGGRPWGDGELVLAELAGGFVVPALLVGLLALCAVVAAVLGLVRKA
jgi:NADH:ubiquinone oxidoreductase subunit 6 (subunit J)